MSWGYDLLMDVNNGPSWEWATRYVLKRSDAMVGDCGTIRNLAVNYGMAPERIVTFPWGANIQKYTPAEVKWRSPIRNRLGWGEEKFVLLSTRSWSEIYGVDDLAEAFVQAARKHPELRLLMLGNGPLAPTVKQIFKQGGVDSLVHFPGQTSQEQLPDYYRAADLYISTSHSDGTSISMLEALASGTPVLLTDIPGNKEWVDPPGEIGWLFGDGDVGSLLNGILKAFENRQELPTMGLSARQIAEARANWETNFPQLFEAYKIALS
jgi:glycosyltransferase involved in cell wall biosynthesis